MLATSPQNGVSSPVVTIEYDDNLVSTSQTKKSNFSVAILDKVLRSLQLNPCDSVIVFFYATPKIFVPKRIPKCTLEL